jgi:type II secretory pathway component PulM
VNEVPPPFAAYAALKKRIRELETAISLAVAGDIEIDDLRAVLTRSTSDAGVKGVGLTNDGEGKHG